MQFDSVSKIYNTPVNCGMFANESYINLKDIGSIVGFWADLTKRGPARFIEKMRTYASFAKTVFIHQQRIRWIRIDVLMSFLKDTTIYQKLQKMNDFAHNALLKYTSVSNEASSPVVLKDTGDQIVPSPQKLNQTSVPMGFDCAADLVRTDASSSVCEEVTSTSRVFGPQISVC